MKRFSKVIPVASLASLCRNVGWKEIDHTGMKYSSEEEFKARKKPSAKSFHVVLFKDFSGITAFLNLFFLLAAYN